MRICCDVCGTAPAAVICCADEAALCAQCDLEVHAANKLAGKHRRLPLHCDAARLPRCDICQDKTAFIFCVEDRALFCQDCDEAIHTIGTISTNHQRLLATGIRVGLISAQNMDTYKHHPEPPKGNSMAQASKNPAKIQMHSASTPASWAIGDFLKLSDYVCSEKESSIGFGELSWFADYNFTMEQASEGSLAAAEVPEMLFRQPNNETFYKPPKSSTPFKRPRIEMLGDHDDFFTVPDIG